MKKKPSRKETDSRPAQPAPRGKTDLPHVAFGIKNYAVMAAGLAAIAAGYITLAAGSITLAPLLLVIGYCVIIPLGLLIR